MRALTFSALGLVLAATVLSLVLASLSSSSGNAPLDGARAPDEDADLAPVTTFQHGVMGTRLEVVLPDAADAADAAQLVFDVFDDVDARMSEWRAMSPLSAVNRNAGAPVFVPEELRLVIRRGLSLGERTGGAFDITWAALWSLWDFNAAVAELPSLPALRAAAARVDFRQVEVDDTHGTVRLKMPGMKLGLGGIAKGYALERAAAELRARGVEDFMISAGGQVFAAGQRGTRSWTVGIRDPRGERGDFFATVSVRDASVSTSGDYERFFIIDGVRYHHILDPRTGLPARGVRSATVIAADPILADSVSTAVVVMGIKAGMALLESFPGVEGLLVDENGKVHATPGVHATFVHPPRHE